MRSKRKLSLLAIIVLAAAMAPSAWAISSDGLVAWWPFQGNANDAGGNSNHGTVYGATLTQDRFGNPDSAYEFDGINDFIDIGSGVKPPLPLTVVAWVKLDDLSTRQNPVFRNDLDQTPSYDYRYGVSLFAGSWAGPDGGYIDAQIYEGFSAPWNRRNKVSTEPVVTTGSWHHLAAVYGSINDIRLYWDGTEIGGRYDGSGSSLLYSASGHGALGLNREGIYLDGMMDDVAVYSRILSQNEIWELAQSDAVIPAPSACVLGAIGAGVLGWLRRRRMF